MHTGLLAVQQRDKLDKLIAARHAELMRAVTASSEDLRLIKGLKSQQTAWTQYRTEECGLIGALTGAGGSWPSTYAVQCETRLAEERARRLLTARRCVEKKVAEKQAFDLNTCLYQLAPLAGMKPPVN